MKDIHMISAALLLSVIGLIGLYILSFTLLLPESVPSASHDGKVALKGTIVSVENRPGLARLTVAQEVIVIVFDDISMAEGQEIRVFGSLSGNGVRTEIIADKIISVP